MNTPQFFIGRCLSLDCATRRHVEAPADDPLFHPRTLKLICQKHSKPLVWSKVEATHSQAHECDARCMSAIGPVCECSCGGLNHGRGFHFALPSDTIGKNQLQLF